MTTTAFPQPQEMVGRPQYRPIIHSFIAFQVPVALNRGRLSIQEHRRRQGRKEDPRQSAGRLLLVQRKRNERSPLLAQHKQPIEEPLIIIHKTLPPPPPPSKAVAASSATQTQSLGPPPPQAPILHTGHPQTPHLPPPPDAQIQFSVPAQPQLPPNQQQRQPNNHFEIGSQKNIKIPTAKRSWTFPGKRTSSTNRSTN